MLAIEGIDCEAIGIFATDELAIVFGVAFDPGVGTSRRDRQRHPAERENLETDVWGTLDNCPDRADRQFRRQLETSLAYGEGSEYDVKRQQADRKREVQMSLDEQIREKRRRDREELRVKI